MEAEKEPSADRLNAGDLSGLTRREREMLVLVAQGLESKEIGRLLGLAPGTVDQTIKRACKRMGMSRRKELARLLVAREPNLYQSTIQRLDSVGKPLVSDQTDRLEEAAAAERNRPPASWWWPVPTREQQWNELSAWEKRGWAAAIAIGLSALAALLLTLSDHTLTHLHVPKQAGGKTWRVREVKS